MVIETMSSVAFQSKTFRHWNKYKWISQFDLFYNGMSNKEIKLYRVSQQMLKIIFKKITKENVHVILICNLQHQLKFISL